MISGRPKKVCILINELLRGGAQRIVLDIANTVDRKQVTLTVVCLKSPEHFSGGEKNIQEEVKHSGTRVVSLHGAPRFGFAEAWRLFRFLRVEQPDILHTFLPYAGILGRVIGRLAGVRVIISTQCNLPVAYAPRLYWLDRLTLPLATAWTGATEAIEVSYGGSSAPFSIDTWQKGRRHCTVVAGVDLPAFDARVRAADCATKRQEIGIPDGAVLVLMLARFVSWKGHASLIAALPFLPRSVHIALVGWGPLESELKVQTEKLGVADRVHFLGVREDVPELLAAADVYVQTHSHAEDGRIWKGPNTSQMEACAAGIPSVSTAVPLIEYLIEDGVTGLLARPDDPKDIARVIATEIDHPEQARRMAAQARARIEKRYSVAAMTRSYTSLYDAAV